MSKILNTLMLCLSMCLFAYIICLATKNISPPLKAKEDGSGIFVYVSGQNLPLEKYLTGALSAAVLPEFSDETIKAQCAIIRSAIVAKALEGKSGKIDGDSLDLAFNDAIARQALYGSAAYEMEERLFKAAADTKGMVLKYQGNVIAAPYFYLSAGSTRDGRAVLGEGYGYLTAVSCDRDFMADGYIKEYSFSWDKARSLTKSDISYNDILYSNIYVTYDLAGYATKVSFGAKSFSGEDFKRMLGLNSAAFEIEAFKDEIRIFTKGVGLGLGFAQYAADIKAKEGMDYIDLLYWFYDGVLVTPISRQ